MPEIALEPRPGDSVGPYRITRFIGRGRMGVVFEGVEECKPCYWMDQAFGSGAETAMAGRGGLRARIVKGGVLRRDG